MMNVGSAFRRRRYNDWLEISESKDKGSCPGSELYSSLRAAAPTVELEHAFLLWNERTGSGVRREGILSLAATAASRDGEHHNAFLDA